MTKAYNRLNTGSFFLLTAVQSQAFTACLPFPEAYPFPVCRRSQTLITPENTHHGDADADVWDALQPPFRGTTQVMQGRGWPCAIVTNVLYMPIRLLSSRKTSWKVL